MSQLEVESHRPDRSVPGAGPTVHHIAVQTADLANSVAWYRDFLGCRETWSLERFSDETRRRLPGIRRLTEVVSDGFRLHLFERDGLAAAPIDGGPSVQHLCLSTASAEELRRWRRRWLDLFASGRYRFALPDRPTRIDTDDRGVQSFYALDVNGLELEFTYVPGGG
jgi:catechol 2,3-dioxygenase-like lactoylglutathione lyase family enzyme